MQDIKPRLIRNNSGKEVFKEVRESNSKQRKETSKLQVQPDIKMKKQNASSSTNLLSSPQQDVPAKNDSFSPDYKQRILMQELYNGQRSQSAQRDLVRPRNAHNSSVISQEQDQGHTIHKNRERLDKLYNDAQWVQKRRQEMLQLKSDPIQEELKECTFRPNTTSGAANRKDYQKRTTEEFLNSQNQYLKSREEKRKIIAEEQKRRELGDKAVKVKKLKLDDKQWVERFSKREERKSFQDPNVTFQPKISAQSKRLAQGKRGEKNTFDGLVQDSKVRKDREKENEMRKQEVARVKAQEKSMKILYAKFEREYHTAYRQILQLPHLNENEQPNLDDYSDLSQEQVFQLLEELGYLPHSCPAESPSYKLALEIPALLQSRLTRRNILVFLCQIEKIILVWMLTQPGQVNDAAKEGQPSMGRVSNAGMFEVTEKEALRLFTKFELLTRNRKKRLEEQKKQKIGELQQKYQQKPKNFIDKNSKKILEEKAKKGGAVTERKKKDVTVEEIKEVKEQKECTFKPNLSAKYKPSKNLERFDEKRQKDQIFADLYKKKEKKEDVKTDDIEYNRNKGELTFKPDLGKTKDVNTKVAAEKRYTSPDKLPLDNKKGSRASSRAARTPAKGSPAKYSQGKRSPGKNSLEKESQQKVGEASHFEEPPVQAK